MDPLVREAQPRDAKQLSDIARRSKAHWGYTPEQITLWSPVFLTIAADYIAEHRVWAASLAGAPVGFAAL